MLCKLQYGVPLHSHGSINILSCNRNNQYEQQHDEHVRIAPLTTGWLLEEAILACAFPKRTTGRSS